MYPRPRRTPQTYTHDLTMELFNYEFEYWNHFSFLDLGIGFEAWTKVNKLNLKILLSN